MTRKDFELIAGILAKHKADEAIVNAFAVELADTNPRFDKQRFIEAAMPLKRTIYVASAWWSDCDAFVTVAGNSPKAVERAISRAMKDSAVDAYNQSEPEDKRTVRDFLRDISWSGINGFAFDAIISASVIEAYEADGDTVVHQPDMDYHDYEALRDGVKDAVIFLAC